MELKWFHVTRFYLHGTVQQRMNSLNANHIPSVSFWWVCSGQADTRKSARRGASSIILTGNFQIHGSGPICTMWTLASSDHILKGRTAAMVSVGWATRWRRTARQLASGVTCSSHTLGMKVGPHPSVSTKAYLGQWCFFFASASNWSNAMLSWQISRQVSSIWKRTWWSHGPKVAARHTFAAYPTRRTNLNLSDTFFLPWRRLHFIKSWRPSRSKCYCCPTSIHLSTVDCGVSSRPIVHMKWTFRPGLGKMNGEASLDQVEWLNAACSMDLRGVAWYLRHFSEYNVSFLDYVRQNKGLELQRITKTLRWNWQGQQRAWSQIPSAWHVWIVSCKWFQYWVAPSSSSVVWLQLFSACSSWLHCLLGTKILDFMLCNLWAAWSWSVALVSAARHWIRFEMTQHPIAWTSGEPGALMTKTGRCSGPRWEETRMVLQRCHEMSTLEF